MSRGRTPSRRRREGPFHPERCRGSIQVRAMPDERSPAAVVRRRPSGGQRKAPERRPPRARSISWCVSLSFLRACSAARVAGYGPFRPYGFTENFTSRVKLLFAILSVIFTSSRYSPSGNDASGTACPLCSWCPAARSNSGGKVCAFRFWGLVLLKNFSPALQASPGFGSFPAAAWQKLYSTSTSGLLALSVFGL